VASGRDVCGFVWYSWGHTAREVCGFCKTCVWYRVALGRDVCGFVHSKDVLRLTLTYLSCAIGLPIQNEIAVHKTACGASRVLSYKIVWYHAR